MPHTAKALVLHCIDYRFVHEIVHYLKSLGLRDQYDDVSLAGGVKNLVDPYDPTDPEVIYRQIAIAKKLHQIEEVILINHTDCGAYGGRAIFSSGAEEEERHVKDLQRAKEMIEHHFADEHPSKVSLVLAKIDDAGAITFAPLKA